MDVSAATDPSPAVTQEAQRLFREFHALCFWSHRPDLEITPDRVAWVREQLRRNGGMKGWRAAQRLGTDS